MDRPRHIVFVCTGNICRSPTAHAVLRHLIAKHRLEQKLSVDSAGLQDWHAGASPDARSIRHARQRGYPMSDLRARAFKREDFEHADLVLVMDDGHLLQASRLCPPKHADKLCLLTDYCRKHEAREVPDPYDGTARDFEHVLDLVEDACEGLLRHMGLLR